METDTTQSETQGANGNSTRAAYRKTKRMKASERKEQILEVSRNVIVQEGYGQFSLRYIADQAGIRLATLQHYFASKEELFRATFEHAIALERTRLDAVIDQDTVKTPGSQLKARLTGYFRAEQNADTVGIFYQLWARSYLDDFARQLMDEFYDRQQELLVALIQAFNPDLSHLEASRRSIMVQAFLEGMSLFVGESRKDRPEMEDIENKVLNMIFTMVNTPDQEWP